MLQASFYKYTLRFKRPSGTSRGTLTKKDSWIITVWDDANPAVEGIGECGLLKGLSCDPWTDYEKTLREVCENIERHSQDFQQTLMNYPSIRFGVEMALLDLEQGGKQEFFNTPFTHGKAGIPINGLIWMGNEGFMQEQIDAKLEQGYDCIKMKIGAINFNQEYAILKNLRKRYSKEVLEIRVDANGSFSAKEAFIRLDELSKLHLHSIEQPIAAKQIEDMKELCAVTPVPIALDEELIGVHRTGAKEELLSSIQPQYIILKPSLVGGFKASEEWIRIAEQRNIDWWATSALESNIGLNAIAQWTSSKATSNYQGLGTGQLYTNNIDSDLEIRQAKLWKNRT